MAHHPYHALQQLLDKTDTTVSAATIHGLWCGRLAAGDTLGTTEWWSYTQQVLGQDAVLADNMISAFKAVAAFADQHLQQDSFTFEPWLPADDAECRLRVTALSDWCQGFIEGLTSVLGGKLVSAPDDVKEILQDLLDIGEVDPDVGGTEEDEKQLLELTEFVKVAALNIWHEFAENPSNASGEEPSGPTIH